MTAFRNMLGGVRVNMLKEIVNRLRGNRGRDRCPVLYKEPRAVAPVKAVVLADLHLCFPEDMRKILDILETEKYDCVLFLGDIWTADIKKIVSHAGGRPCFYVLGNHDEWLQNCDIDGLTDLDGQTAEIRGVKISGVSGAPRYRDECNFCMRTEDEVVGVLRNIGDTDILISHESPYHLLNKNPAHSGYLAIADFLKEKDVPIHLFGHHHIAYSETVGSAHEICVYGCAIVCTNPFKVRHIVL